MINKEKKTHDTKCPHLEIFFDEQYLKKLTKTWFLYIIKIKYKINLILIIINFNNNNNVN